MAFCPNINSVEVKNKFNGVVTMFNGKPLSDEEFKSKDLRAERTGDDLLAMNVAYFVWDKYQGENIPESRETIEKIIFENNTKELVDNVDKESQKIKKFNSELNNSLLSFLKGLNINVKFNADELLDELSFKGKSPLAAFDILQKFLAFKSGSETLLPEQAAYIIYSFLGKKSKLSKDLWFNIQNWSEYKKYYEEFYHKFSDIDYDTIEAEDRISEDFHAYAHKLTIIKFIEKGLIGEFGDIKPVNKRENFDITAEYYDKKGRKNPYKGTILEKIWARIYNYAKDLFTGKVFPKYTEDQLIDLVLDIADDVFKQDYKKFLRGIQEKDGELYDKNGNLLEVKDYKKTLEKDLFAKEIIESLVNHPFIDYKLSGSQTVRKYGTLYRPLDEDLHDIDGVITLEQFRKEENSYEFLNWLKTRGLKLTKSHKDKEFKKEVLPFLENQSWYQNVKQLYPSWSLKAVFIGKDHTHAESLTITGTIDHPTELNENGEKKKYIIDFFLRTDEGKYPEIFDNYWKDWKQIFEAKLNMGRSKDIADLIYFSPFINDKFKFTNKGFRYFSFEENIKNEYSLEELIGMLPKADVSESQSESEAMYQLSDESVPEAMKQASEEQIKQVESLVKTWLKRMGIKFENVPTIIDPDGNVIDAIAKASIMENVIQVVEGKRDITTLSEEAFHFLVELLGENNPLVAKMMENITSYEVYQETLKEYAGTYEGNETKIKKEAIGKALARLFVQEQTGIDAELFETKTRTEQLKRWFNRFWERVKQLFGVVSTVEITDKLSPFRETINMITSEDQQEFITPSGTIRELTYYQADTQRKKAEFDNVIKAINGLKVTYDPVTKTYYTNGKPIKYRVTDAVKKFYLRIFKNPDKETGKRELLLADKGTYVHALLQSITEKRINNERIVPSKLIEDVKQELRSKSPDFLQYDNSFFDITDDQYNQLVKGVNYILKEIETKTKVINEKTGLTGSAKIMTELAVYDKETDTAGTIDLAVVYPNGAIGIYDFKGINFFMKDNKIVNKLPTYKLSAYDIQINGYKRLLSSMLREQGVEAHFAETRIVPINMQLKYDRNGTREDGFRMLQMGDKRSNDNPFIDQISVAEEYTISESINLTLKNFYNLKSKLSERLASDPRNSKLQIEYEKVNSHINDILIRKSFDFAYKELKSLFENIEARRMFTPDDPNYITKEDLLYYVDYLKLYQQFTSNVEAGISNLIQSDKDAFMKVAYYLEKINHQVSTLQLERASEESDNIDLTKPGKKLSLMGRLFKTLSQIDHPAFQKLAKMVQNNYNETHIRVNEDIKEIEKIHNNLSEWVKKKGKSLQWGFDQIVNRKTGKLVGKIAAQWYKDRNTAREKRNYAWFRDFAQVTVVNNKYFYTGEAKELFEKRRAEYIKYVNNAYYGEANKAKRNKMITEWDNAHNITVNREALFNSRNYFIKSNDKDQYLTEEWKNLQKPENKALKDYYDMYIAFNKRYAELTGKDIDHNFIANIHKDLMDGLGESGLSSIKDMTGFFLRSLEVQQSDVLVGEIDPDTGLPIQKIPYLYTSEMSVKLSKKEEKQTTEDTLKKLRLAAKKDGRNIDENSVEVQEAIKNAIWYAERQKGLKFKSYDLTRSLILFSQASHTYALQKQTESDVLNLLELIKSKHVKTFIKNEKGSLVKKEDGSVEPMSVEGMSEEDQKIFERMVNVYWYGQHMDPLTFKLGNKELSGSKLIKMLMNFVSLKAIGLKPILAAGQFLNIKGNLYMSANEGIFFNNKQVNDAQKAAFRRDPKYRAAVEFFEARANPITYRKALFKSSSKIVKTVNLENAFYLHRKGDEVVEDNVLVAMMMNYGITKDGKVDRLSRIKKMEGQPSKSLWELASIDKNGKFSVEGLSQDQFKEFRTRVIGVGRVIKGNMTEMDKSLIGTYTLGAMLMHFKTWMQELGRQRFGEAQYDSMTGEIFLPRFRTAFGDIFTQTDSILKELGGLFLELAFIKNKKLNENAARYYYEKFLSQNPHLEGQITFEDYVEIREAKIRGMVREIQFYLSFIAMALFAKGMIPDDEDKIRKQAAINGYLIINRTLLEFSFWFSPSSVEQLIRFPIATGSFVIDLAEMFGNGFEELYNLLLGIEDTRDRTPMFHYMGKHIPGINSILDFIGYYENANLQINT